MNGETAMKFELTLAQRRDDSTDVGSTLGQPCQPTLLSGVVPVGAISVLRRGLVWGRSGQDRFSMGSFWSTRGLLSGFGSWKTDWSNSFTLSRENIHIAQYYNTIPCVYLLAKFKSSWETTLTCKSTSLDTKAVASRRRRCARRNPDVENLSGSTHRLPTQIACNVRYIYMYAVFEHVEGYHRPWFKKVEQDSLNTKILLFLYFYLSWQIFEQFIICPPPPTPTLPENKWPLLLKWFTNWYRIT